MPQQVAIDNLRQHWSAQNGASRRLMHLLETSRVQGRYLALTVPEYQALDSFAKANCAWSRIAAELAEAAAYDSLARTVFKPQDVDHIFFVTGTGIATPSLDTCVINRMQMRANVKRTPIFGLGCAGGASGVARAADYLRAFPQHVALVISVELCSLTLQRNDVSPANLIASTLFGDGAACVVLCGSEATHPGNVRVIDSHSTFFRDTERVMGWDIVDSGFKIVMSPEIPNLVRSMLGSQVDAFLTHHALERRAVRHWIVHTGGPKVLEAVTEALELDQKTLERSWRLLAQVGNISSTSVLLVLASLLESGEARAGDYGLMISMGPGFCAEFVLLQW
jgi:alkylresorcinol/alkylpyrone synthase